MEMEKKPLIGNSKKKMDFSQSPSKGDFTRTASDEVLCLIG